MDRHRRTIRIHFCAILVAIGVAAFASACDRPDAGPASPARTISASASPPAPPPKEIGTAAAQAPGSGGVLGPGETLMGRLARERGARPAVKPAAEEVLATFDRLGAPIADKQQSLAATYGASYCVGGYTTDRSLALDVCEYADAGAATSGGALSKQLLARVANRDVWVHKADTLAIIQLKADPPTAALKKKLVDSFLAM
ncbi:MAG: hypothetical protein WBY94_31370 [Polyangiaceae bacterium]